MSMVRRCELWCTFLRSKYLWVARGESDEERDRDRVRERMREKRVGERTEQT